MKQRGACATIFLILLGMSLALVSDLEAQQAALVGGMVEGVTGGLSNTLVGYALTAIGLNSQASSQTAIETQLSEINIELTTISAQLSTIQNAIQTETCVDALDSSAVTDALTSIATVSNTYTNLLQAGESASGTVSQANINNFLTQVVMGPSSGLPSISAALVAINIALQSTDNDGIIGTCERAVSALPGTGSFGADATFYSDPINLMQYFADYQTVATLLLVEYYNYEAFFSSPYYSATTISNGLPASQAAQVCQSPTGETATQCGFARSALEQLYVYLQNQYSADGVPYSTKDSSGKLQTGLYLAGNNTNYLFAASLEEFTNFEDPSANCGSVISSGSPCGLTNRDDPSTSPFWTGLQTYQYETAWAPATAPMWRAVLDGFANTSDKSSTTVADALTTLGFQNATDKLILTSTIYSANPEVSNSGGNLFPFSDADAVCLIDTDLERSLSVQPFCYNGSDSGVSYGNSGALLWLWSTWNNGNCMTFRTNGPVLSDSSDSGFYGTDTQYDSLLNSESGVNDGTCSGGGFWESGSEPGWLLQNGLSGSNYFWPAIDMSSPTCGTNLSYGLLQPALTRSPLNFLSVPTMCGADFDRYFATIAPRNPYQQIAFTTTPVSGTVGTSLGPITIQMQDTSTGTAIPLTSTSDTTISLSTTSTNGFFTLTPDGTNKVTSVTIFAGQSSATFYYDDSNQGTPQITADPGTMVPGIQDEIISSDTSAPEEVSATVKHTGTNRTNGKAEIRGQMALPGGIQLQRANLTFSKVLSEDAGSGELVRQAGGNPLNLPVVLAAVPGSKVQTATYITQGNSFPQVQVEIKALKQNPSMAKFQIAIAGAEISGPSACSGNPSSTMLHTQMIANDGIHPSAVVDLNLTYKCRHNGNLVTVAEISR